MSQPRTADIGAASPSSAPAVHASRVAQPYERHRPEETLLSKTLQAHWRTFLSDLESDGDSSALPAFVVFEVEAFLRCRILAHMGLPSLAPAVHLPRPPPQGELPFDASGFEPDPPAPDDFDA